MLRTVKDWRNSIIDFEHFFCMSLEKKPASRVSVQQLKMPYSKSY